MLAVNSRWKIKPPAPASRVAIAAGDGGVMFSDEKGRVTLLDADGKALWTVAADDSIRRVAMTAQGKGGFLLTVHEIIRFGITGKPVWRVAAPPFPLELAVRHDGGAIAVGAESGLIKTYAATGKGAWSRRLAHGCDYLQFHPAGGALLAVSRRGDITFLAGNGEPEWKVSIGCEACRPDLSTQRIAVPSFDGVYAFGPDGAALGIYDVGAPTVRAIFGNDGESLLVQDAKRRLSLLDPVTGDTRWQYSFTDEPRDVAFSADGGSILLAGWAGELERLDVTEVDSARAPAPAATIQPHASGNYLEVDGGAAPTGSRVAPKPRWRTPVEIRGDVEMAVLPGGEGVVVLDREAETVELYRGDALPAWGASHLGPDAKLRVAGCGAPILVGGSRGVRVFDAKRGEIANAAVAARALEVADGGGAFVAGSESARLHLFDARGKPLWDVPTPGFSSIAISPDANVIAIVRGGSILLQVRGGKGGFQKSVAPDVAPDDVALRALVVDDGVFYASRSGRVGLLALDGAVRFEDALPPGFPADRLLAVSGSLLIETRGGVFRADLASGKLAGVPGPARRPETRARFASFMDRLLEFRYDSREIVCLEALGGAVLWRRAVGSPPQAVSVSADGASLAGIVSGELVLYDLVPATQEPSSAPPTETPPTFLEL